MKCNRGGEGSREGIRPFSCVAVASSRSPRRRVAWNGCIGAISTVSEPRMAPRGKPSQFRARSFQRMENTALSDAARHCQVRQLLLVSRFPPATNDDCSLLLLLFLSRVSLSLSTALSLPPVAIIVVHLFLACHPSLSQPAR